jgi:hypothetical protein
MSSPSSTNQGINEPRLKHQRAPTVREGFPKNDRTMTPDQLRQALTELKGQRKACFVFHSIPEPHNRLEVANAMLVPDEPDHLIKLTDGQSIYVIEAEKVAYIRIGM